MEALTIMLLKTVATSCIKYYMVALLAGAQVKHSATDLGYSMPKWYMNPGSMKKEFYSYGTSIDGDEFESLSDAREKAILHMLELMRLSNAKMVSDKIKYDSSSLKQKRLIELFLRGDALEDFVRLNAKQDKKELIKVQKPSEDMRAFVRLNLSLEEYTSFQTKKLNELKSKLMRQKTEDILTEMDGELKSGTLLPSLEPDLESNQSDVSQNAAREESTGMNEKSSVDSAFDELNDALDQ